MKFALIAVLAGWSVAAQAEVATFDGNVQGAALRVESIEKAAAEVAVPQPRRRPDDGIDRVSGHCRLEASDKEFDLKIIDPWMHFGAFINTGEDAGPVHALGFGWGSENLIFTLGDRGDHTASTSLSKSAFFQGVPIRLSVTVPFSKPGSEQTNEWLSCTIKLK